MKEHSVKSYKLKYIKFGTCSWKYDSWKGLIYPSNKKKFNYLSEYSRHFNTVEIDQWFWSLFPNTYKLPSEKDVIEYTNSVPENFKFTIKAPNTLTLTHHYKNDKNSSLIKNIYFLSVDTYTEFIQTLKPLWSKVGLIMFQFSYLNKQMMSDQIEFLSILKHFLDKIEKPVPIAIEIRNPNYLNENYFSFLIQQKIYHVFLQGYYMPNVFTIYRKYKEYIQGKVLIRLHGPNRNEIEIESGNRWDKIIAPKDQELYELVNMLQDLESRKIETYVNVNNHYEGSAPLTIKRIQSLLNT